MQVLHKLEARGGELSMRARTIWLTMYLLVIIGIFRSIHVEVSAYVKA